ncbi:hypothetical protein [Deinococcus sp.]|uniref:hypothetical protein n=1 Tax=Deinococcus sp. TaxID=47478 RepID=UPI003B5A90D7
MRKISLFNSIPNSTSGKAARWLLALGSASVLALPLMASAQTTQTQTTPAQTTQTQNQQGQTKQGQSGKAGQNGPRGQRQSGPLQVSYYSADPLAGGKLISTVTVQPPQRGTQAQGTQATTQRQNPLTAQAPAGAKFAVIKDDHGGARIIDLSQVGQMNGRGFGGPRQNNQQSDGQ